MTTRIVSLVPNATEILFALGAGDSVVGVSHECDYPAAARSRPQLTGSALTQDLDPSAIDRQVSAQLREGESLYTLDDQRLAHLRPDLIVSQELCPVCAVSSRQVNGALEPLASCPDVIYLDPKSLADVLDDIRTLGDRLGRVRQAQELIDSLDRRIDAVRQSVAGLPRPRVVALEWLDPPFIGGHWVPEMIDHAGGLDVLAAPGQASARSDWETIRSADPDVLVVMPCGFDREGAREQIESLKKTPGGETWGALRAVRTGRVAPVDANGCFSRPGPRLVDGIETLAKIFHPTLEVAAEDSGKRGA